AFFFRAADGCPLLDRYYLAGRVAPGRPLFGRRAEYLDDLPEVDVRPEDLPDRARVRREPVAAELEASGPGSATQLLDKLQGVLWRPLADVKGKDQLVRALDCQERPHVPDLFAVPETLPGLFL